MFSILFELWKGQQTLRIHEVLFPPSYLIFVVSHSSDMMNSPELISTAQDFMSMFNDCSTRLPYVKSFPFAATNETHLLTKYVTAVISLTQTS